MKIDISKETLIENLSLVSRFTSGRLAMSPVLSGVQLVVDQDVLHMYATNLTSHIHTQMKIASTAKTTVICEPKKLLEFLQLLPAGKVEMDIKEKTIHITQGKTKGAFPQIVADDFPPHPIIKEKPGELDPSLFKHKLPLVLFAASTDETRPTLTSVNFQVEDDEMTLVSTDGFRLSLIKTDRVPNVSNMLMPADFLSELVKLAKDYDKILFSYSESEKQALFKMGTIELYTRTIDGEFPPYERVIPIESTVKAVVNRDEFVRVAKLSSVFSRDASQVVVLTFEKDGIRMNPKKDATDENSAYLEADITGTTPIQVAFNNRYLLDFLNHMTADTIEVEINRPDSPAVFKIPKEKKFLHIIMPVRISE